jgi:hypothetical protein
MSWRALKTVRPMQNDHHDDGDDETQAYAVGYGKPPINTRFKRGQSGNRNGRPKKQPTFTSDEHILHNTLFKVMPMRIGGKSVQKSPFEIALMQITKQAMAGDVGASRLLIALVTKHNSRKPRLPRLHEMSKQDLHLLLNLIKDARRGRNEK